MFKRIGEKHGTKNSPVYGPFSGPLLTTLIVSTVLFLITVGGMLLIADTELAELALLLFMAPIIGVIVFGIIITLGRYLGLRGIKENNHFMAFIGTILLLFGYSWFGGAVLHLYAIELYFMAILIAAGITLAIALVAGFYVYTTNKDLSHWSKYSATLFMIGIVLALIGTFIPGIIFLAFIFILLGFIADLVYEIWMTSNEKRSPFANGIALYVAFTGTFVHILQLVLQSMARR